MKFASTPAWTLLQRRDAKVDRSIPGPGAYSPSPSKAAPSFSLGTSGRLDWTKSVSTPGPGAYDTRERSKSIGAFLGKSSRDLNMSSPNLGPGAYDIPSMSVEGPAYSMGQKSPERYADTNPGPGAYDTEGFRRVRNRSPSAVLNTTSQRSSDLRETSPGPGAYSPKARHGTSALYASRSFSKDSRRPLSANTRNPGPGAYQLTTQPEGPKYSLGAKARDSERNSVPGPGQYDVSHYAKLKAKEPAANLSMSRSSEPRREESPGPGAYHVSLASTGPKWTLSAKPRGDLNSTTPAPGAYDIPPTFNKTAFSMGRRTEEVRDNSGPGPGAYLGIELRTSSPSFRMGKNPRATPPRAGESPGPGTYTPTKLRSAPTSSFGKERRMSLPTTEGTPGPGAYKPHDSTFGPLFSMLGRNEQNASDKTPGPGQYDLSGYAKVRDRSPGGVMSQAARSFTRHSKSMSEIPGPGNYEPSGSARGPKWVFSKEERLKQPKSDTPAPGAYNVNAHIGKGGFSIAGRDERGAENAVPGPGSYDPKLRDSSPTFKISSSPRKELTTVQGTPGPGTYDPSPLRSSDGHSFVGARRDSPSFGGETPGPGTYSVIANTEGPKFSMGIRSNADLNRSVPGPGQYDQSSFDQWRPRSRGVVMGSEPRSKQAKGEVVPGPGQYSSPQKVGGSGWRFGKEPRDKRLNESFPSPGAYDLPDTKSKLGYTMSSRHLESRDNTTPGPGTYDVKPSKAAPSYSMGGSRTALFNCKGTIIGPGRYTPVLKSSSPNVKFGSAGRTDTTWSSTPGPGAYNHHSAIGKESPGFSIRGRMSDVQDQSTPGPGKYSPMTSVNGSPAYPFSKQARDPAFKAGDDSVGPGVYYSPLKTTNPVWSFGKDPRDQPLHSDSPGPGQYTIKPSVPDVASYAVLSSK